MASFPLGTVTFIHTLWKTTLSIYLSTFICCHLALNIFINTV